MATTTKYDIPLDHLDYGYVNKCQDVKELEKIVKILRSGEEGRYPELEATAEKKLAELNPKSKVLRKDQPIMSTRDLPKDDQKNIFEEIDCWSSDIKTVESGLAQSKTSNGVLENGNLPPVRGAGNISVEKQNKPSPQDSGKSNKRVKPRDYKEWDKVDIDAELQKIDQDDSTKSNGATTATSGGGLRSNPNIPETVPSSGLTDDEKNFKAEKEKEKGNEAFRSGDYQEAVLYYTRSLSLNSNIAARNNRAQSYLKLEKWDKAITDVEAVLAVEGDNVKAYLRRGVAYQGKRKYREAKTDIAKVLELEPNNKRAKIVLDELETSLSEQKAKGRRMVIEETDGTSDEEDKNIEEIVIGGNKTSQPETMSSKAEEVTTPKIQEVQPPKIEEVADVLTQPTVVTQQTTKQNESEVKEPSSKKKKKNKSKKKGGGGNGGGGHANASANQESQKQNVATESKQPVAESVKKENETKSQTETKSQNKTKLQSETASKSSAAENKTESETKVEAAASTPVIQPAPPLPPAVIKLKDDGNKLFKNGHYADAMTKYTNAINKIESDPLHSGSVTVLYSNRAACKHKTGDCNGCIEDCNIALSLTPGSIKPLLRRAMAYETLEKYRHAYVDYKQIVLIDRSAEIAQLGANRCQNALQQTDGTKWRDKLPAMSPMPTTHSPMFPNMQQPTLNKQSETPTGSQPKTKTNTSVKNQAVDTSAKKAVDTNTKKAVDTSANKAGNNLSDADKLKLFTSAKDKGNNHVKKSDFASAIKCYTLCITLCPDQTVAYNNRALCFLRTDQATKAVADCNKVLEGEAENVKALFRKAQALKMLKQYSESQSLLEHVLELDKSNTAAKRELHVVQKCVMEEKSKEKSSSGRKKMVIQEVSSDEESEGENTVPEVSSKPETNKQQPKTSSSNKQTFNSKESSSKEPVKNGSKMDNVKAKNDATSQSIKTENKKNSSKISELAASTNKTEAVKEKVPKVSDNTSDKTQFVDYEKKAAKSSSKIRPTAGMMGNSTTSKVKLDRATPFEFVSAWTSLKTTKDVNQYLALLQQVEPHKLPSVISNKLEGNMLYTIIKCASELTDQGKCSPAYEYLNNLTGVQRFEMNTMFMSSAEKQELQSVLGKLRKKTDSTYSLADLDKLGKKYGI